MMYLIKNTQTGNCACYYCKKFTGKFQPFTLWHKSETEKRGHNLPMCSKECCEKYINDFFK